LPLLEQVTQSVQITNLIGRESVNIEKWLMDTQELIGFLTSLPCGCVAPKSKQVTLNMWTHLQSSV